MKEIQAKSQSRKNQTVRFWILLTVIKCIYLLPTYLYFIQDIEDMCLLLMSPMSFVDLPFQEHRMMEKHHMDQKSMYIFIMSKIRHSHRQYDMRK
jgi:flagellar biosynthesis protein FlhB